MSRACVLVLLLWATRNAAFALDKEIALKQDESLFVLVVPKADLKFAVGAKVMQLIGTECAWDRDAGVIEPENPSDDRGFELRDELKTNKIGIGYSAETIRTILDGAAKFGITSDYVSVLGVNQIDKDAKVRIDKVDISRFRVVKVRRLGKSSGDEVSFMIVESDLGAP